MPVLAREEVVAVLAFCHFRERGEDQHLVGLASAVASRLGAPVQRKRAEAAQAVQARTLAEQATELERSNAELEQFAYVASHDLQEPLRMVGSYTQLLERRYAAKLDEDAREFIRFAVDGVRRVRALIDDLLAYSRTGTRATEPGPTDVAAVLESVLQNLGPATEESGARVTHDPLPTIPADAGQVGQLLRNLIANALKFRREGMPPRVHVGVHRDGATCVLTVRDNGIGIAPEFRDRIVVVFQRLHSRDEYPGTGIGLAIRKKIVERHGGRIRVESTPGGGTTFHLSFPLEQSE